MPSNAWDVWHNDRLIDTVWFDKDYTAVEVARSLVEHDGYPVGISVERTPECRHCGGQKVFASTNYCRTCQGSMS